MGTVQAYSSSLAREQFLLNETRIVARLHADEHLGTEEIVARVHDENLFQYKTERSLTKKARGVCRRIDALGNETLINLIAHGPAEQAAQVNMYAMMCSYRLVWEFMVNVIGEKYRVRDYSLQRYECSAFLDSLRAMDDGVAAWSDTTMNKTRQILVGSMAATGMLSSVRSTELIPILLDMELEEGIRRNGDDIVLPSFNCIAMGG